MFALLCVDADTAKYVREQSEGIFDFQVVTKMSVLESIAPQIEGIFLDQRLGDQVVNAVRGKFHGMKIYVFETPFFLSEAMGWYESQRAGTPPVQPTTAQVATHPAQPAVDHSPEREPVTQGTSYADSVARFNQEQTGDAQRGYAQTDRQQDGYVQPERFSAGRGGRKRVVPVFMLDSPKGGQGRSTIGAHMAYYGALQGKKVAIIDLDPNGDINAKFGLLQATDNRGWRGNSVDEAVRDRACLVHDSGLYIFPSPQHQEAALQSPEDALHFLTLCIEEMDAVFLDMPQGWTPIHTTVLPLVTKVITVVSPNIDSLDRIQEHMEKIQHANVALEDVVPIVNKSKSRSDLAGMKQYMTPYKAELSVPFDRDIAKKGGLNGKLLIRTCQTWWDEMYGLTQAHQQKSKKKWRLFGR